MASSSINELYICPACLGGFSQLCDFYHHARLNACSQYQYNGLPRTTNYNVPTSLIQGSRLMDIHKNDIIVTDNQRYKKRESIRIVGDMRITETVTGDKFHNYTIE